MLKLDYEKKRLLIKVISHIEKTLKECGYNVNETTIKNFLVILTFKVYSKYNYMLIPLNCFTKTYDNITISDFKNFYILVNEYKDTLFEIVYDQKLLKVIDNTIKEILNIPKEELNMLVRRLRMLNLSINTTIEKPYYSRTFNKKILADCIRLINLYTVNRNFKELENKRIELSKLV